MFVRLLLLRRSLESVTIVRHIDSMGRVLRMK